MYVDEYWSQFKQVDPLLHHIIGAAYLLLGVITLGINIIVLFYLIG
jgi:hypothetical protein